MRRAGNLFERGLFHPELIHREIFESDIEGGRAFLDTKIAAGRVDKLRIAEDRIFVPSQLVRSRFDRRRIGNEKQVLVNSGAIRIRSFHTCGTVSRHQNIAIHLIFVPHIPNVRVQTVVHDHIVPSMAAEAFTQFEPLRQQQVVVDVVVARSVIQIDVPAVVTAPTAVADDRRFDRIQQGSSATCFATLL